MNTQRRPGSPPVGKRSAPVKSLRATPAAPPTLHNKSQPPENKVTIFSAKDDLTDKAAYWGRQGAVIEIQGKGKDD